jgi:acyl-CoA dehydrogenase
MFSMLLRSKIRLSRGFVGIPPRGLEKRYFSAHVDVTESEAFRISLRRWVDKSVIPNINSWEEKGQLPRSIYKEAAQLGVLAPGFPERYGGLGNEHNDLSVLMVVCEELCRAGSGGFIASLLTHNISLQPIIKLGRQEIANNVATKVLSGEAVCSLCISEPSGGSDVANMKTTATAEGDHFLLRGEKTFITSGMQADYLTVAARTGDSGAGGISLFLVDANTQGVERTKLDKMGWLCSDTATIYFNDCVVPRSNLLGEENRGFEAIMENFNAERIFLAGQCVYFSKELVHQSVEWAKDRQTFGQRLIDHQAIRHKLVDMSSNTASAEAYLNHVLDNFHASKNCIADISMLKNIATDNFQFCADGAVQIFGGAGFIRGHMVERLYRETKVMQIGGGSTEIMKDLAAKHLGWFE